MQRQIMQVVIEIKTPKGSATKTEKRIRPFIMPLGSKHKTWTSPEDDTIYWEVEDDLKKVMKIQRNIAMFDMVIKNIFQHKVMKQYGIPKLSKEDQDELKKMLENHTSVTIIKRANLMRQEPDGQTWWQKIKEKFKTI